MTQFEPPGVKRLPRCKRMGPSAVQFIAHDRGPEVTQVHPDLMGAPGVQAAFDQAHRAAAEAALGQSPEGGACRTTRLTVNHCHPDPLRRIAADGLIDLGALGDQPGNQGQVAPPHRAIGQLFGQCRHRRLRSRNNHQATGVLVQTMHDAGARQGSLRRKPMQQPVEQGAMPVARSGMHHQTGPLVHHQQVRVFVYRIELDRFGRKRLFSLQWLSLDQQCLDADQPVPPTEHALIPAHRTEFDPALQSRARKLGQLLRKKAVKPLPRRAHGGQLEQARRGLGAGICHGYNVWMIRHLFKTAGLLGLCVVLTLAGCGTFEQPDETVGWPPDKLYSEASREIDRRNWGEAIKLLEKLESRYPFGRWAEQAQLQIAFSHYRNNERVLAIAALDRFMKLHPNHPAFDYALYMKGVVNFNEQEGLFAMLGGQDLAERDLQAARDAFDAFRTLTTRFPNSGYTADAQARMVYLIDAMAAGELAVARYYFRRGAYVAAANRAQNIIRQFPTARPTEQALIMLADSYDKLGMPDLRDDTRRVLQNTFPNATAAVAPDKAAWWRFWR